MIFSRGNFIYQCINVRQFSYFVLIYNNFRRNKIEYSSKKLRILELILYKKKIKLIYLLLNVYRGKTPHIYNFLKSEGRE